MDNPSIGNLKFLF